MEPIPETIKSRLASENWDEIIPRLTNYALKKVRRLSWKGFPKSIQIAEDIVMDAICKTYTGERVWSPEDRPDRMTYRVHQKTLIRSVSFEFSWLPQKAA